MTGPEFSVLFAARSWSKTMPVKLKELNDELLKEISEMAATMDLLIVELEEND